MVWSVCSMDEQSSRSLGWTQEDPKETTTGAAAEDPAVGGPFACFHPGRGDQTSAEFLECDYERNCTPLYRAIEDEDWEHVNHFLTRGKWPGKLFYDATTAADQARTWVTRYAPAANGKNNNNSDRVVIWSQLPLHLCCILDAPYEIVSRLLEIYPAAARSLDDQTNLPLHILLQRGASDRIVDLLLVSFPEAVNVKGKNGLTPLECADDKMVHGRVFRAIFGLDGSSPADDQVSRANSLLDTSKGENSSASFGNIARTRSGGSSSKERRAVTAAASDVPRTDGMSTSKNLKSSVDVLRLNSLEYKTNRELAELRKELQAVASMAESRADVDELKAEIQNLRRLLRAKEHSAAAAAQLQLENSRGSKGKKGKSKKSSSSSTRSHGGVERPRSPFGRRRSSRHSSSGSNRSGVQNSLSWSKSSNRSEQQQQQVDNTDSVSIGSSVVSSKHHEYEVSMLPKASMLDADSSDDSSDDDSVDEDTESSSEQPEQPSPPRQQQLQQKQQLSKKKKKQHEKQRSKKISQQQLQMQKKQKQPLHQDFDSDQTEHDIVLAHHPRQVDSRCQCVIL